MQPFVEKLWEFAGQTNFFFGLSYHMVRHKDFITFKEKFEVAGKLKIRDSFKNENGVYNYAASFADFERIFIGTDKRKKMIDMLLKCPVAIVCE